MAKITVQAAAKRLGMDPDSCLKKLQQMGIVVRDQLDQIEVEVLQQVKMRLEEEKARAQAEETRTSKRIGNKVIRRRRKEEPEAEAAEEEPAVEPAPTPPELEPLVHEEPVVELPGAAAAEAAPVSAEAPVAGEQPAGEAELPPAPAAETEPAVEPTPEEAALEAEPARSTIGEQPTEEGEPKVHIKARAKPGKPGLAEAKPRQVHLREVTREPAKILSRPAAPIATLKPGAAERAAPPRRRVTEPAKPGAPVSPTGPVPPGEVRGRKGRRVVDFADRGRKREEDARELSFLRARRQKKKKGIKQTEITTPKAIKRKIKITDSIQVGEFSKRMGIKAGDVIKQLMSMGMLVTIVHDIDFDTASIIASEFGFEVENVSVEAEDLLEKIESRTEDMESRPPVVTIMGHVDHGKTTLLDAIRETDVAGHEAGGITQHIGAYNVTLPNGRQITFVDTPGHESFAAMRARGAQVTDIVVLVVAADDGIMPQTIESINHAKDANVTIVVAVNKIDKENANPERIRQELLAYGLVPEDLGGETLYAMISAKKRTGIEDLLDAILLQAEMMDLKSDPTRRGQAVVLDARLERGLGPVAAVLVKEGTLRKGNFIVADNFYGRLRMMFDDHGNEVAEALPGVPVQVIGLGGVPRAGVILNSVPDEKTAKAMATLRTNQARVDDYKKRAPVRLEDLYAQIKEGELKEIKILLKGDVQGSVEAVRDALEKLSNDDVKVRIIHSAVGTITETDINFASASNALVIGFSVRPETKVKMLAEQSKVEIRLYNVIYDLLNDIKASIQGMLPPTFTEVVNGVAEVRNTFHISKIGTVAGCYVLEGKIVRNSKVRLMRDGAVVYTGNIGNLKRFKDDAREVQTGFECGISIDGYNDVKLGDRIESYNVVESRPDAPES